MGLFSLAVQCRLHLLLVKFENLVHGFFRNENSTLETNVSHFGVLHWQQWQPPASAPTPKVLAKQFFPSTDCDLHIMQCPPPRVPIVPGESFSKICTHVPTKTFRGQYGIGKDTWIFHVAFNPGNYFRYANFFIRMLAEVPWHDVETFQSF